MKPQNETPSQPNANQGQTPVSDPLTDPHIIAQANPVAVPVTTTTDNTSQQPPNQNQSTTNISSTIPPAPAATIESPVESVPQSANNSQQLPSVTSSSSPLATPPNIPPSQLKEYLSKQAASADEPNQTQSGGNSGFEFMIVSMQFITIAILLLDFFSPLLFRSTTAMVFGAILIGLGIALAIWARASFKQHMKVFPSPSEKGFLVTGGPYSLIRHPVYTGLLLACLGLVLIYPSVFKIIAFIVLVFIMMAKTKYEERMLANKYSGYTIYQEHTGKVIPKIS